MGDVLLFIAFVFVIGMWNIRHFIQEGVRKINQHREYEWYATTPRAAHKDRYLEHEKQAQGRL